MHTATEDRLSGQMLQALGVDPTTDQLQAIKQLAVFLSGDDNGVFILKGYAGTGKTTLLSALTRALRRFVLLAPTGRAAKVLSGYSGFAASTIHRHIYKVTSSPEGRMVLARNENKKSDIIYIIDESSMIGDGAGESYDANLLDDLIDFVAEGKNCRMILVGDQAQLPPVHSDYSPALDIENIRSLSNRHVSFTELKQVVRQKEAGGILLNATSLRILINRNATLPVLKTEGFTDIEQVSGADLKEKLEDAYAKYGQDEVLVITRSNKSANNYNQLIRRQLLWFEDELSSGDRLMVVKNNYFWLDKDSKAGFIANGDTVEVQRIFNTEEKHGFRFSNVQLKLVDYPDEPAFEAVILLDTLYSPAPALLYDENRKLYDSVLEQYINDKKTERNKKIRADNYMNALQVKFAYAVTCHKAQGGQWKAVFVDQGFMTEEMESTAHLRWLYTAFTRATEKLCLINFDEKVFKTG